MVLVLFFIIALGTSIVVSLAFYKKDKENTFTASKGGPYRIDEAAKRFYSYGVDDGASDKRSNRPYHSNGHGTEVVYKDIWAMSFGIPNNDKAKKVYNRLLQKYKEGYDEGYKF